MKYKDILDKKVIFEENLGDKYYWDYRIIVQIDENNIVLIEYEDSYSGWLPFAVETVDKEFISSFFDTYGDKNRKVKLNYESADKLEDLIDFRYDEGDLEEEIIVLELNDIKDYIMED